MKGNKISRTIFIWEAAGVLFIITIGSLLHFTFQWSNNSSIVGAFSPVNESVWEHLKMGFWSLFIFSLFEYPVIKDKINNFFTAKLLGILSLELIIVIFFYLYTSLAGHSILFIDISLYVIGSIVCQIVSYNILLKNKFSRGIEILSIFLLILLAASFIIFTFYPPELPLFKDPRNNTYGISLAAKMITNYFII